MKAEAFAKLSNAIQKVSGRNFVKIAIVSNFAKSNGYVWHIC